MSWPTCPMCKAGIRPGTEGPCPHCQGWGKAGWSKMQEAAMWDREVQAVNRAMAFAHEAGDQEHVNQLMQRRDAFKLKATNLRRDAVEAKAGMTEGINDW